MRLIVLTFLLCLAEVFAADHPASVIVATADQAWFPISYPNEAGEYTGIWEERLQDVFVNQLKVDLEVQRVPWIRAQKSVELGRSDIMITIPTPERLAYTTPVSGKFFSLEFHLLLRSDHPEFDRLNQLQTLEDILKEDLTFVSTHGNGWFKSQVADKGARTQYVATDENMIQFLLAKRADAAIDVPPSIKFILEKYNAGERLRFTPAILAETPFSILVSNDSPWLNHLDAIADALVETNRLLPY